MKVSRFVWIGLFTVVLTVLLITLFACNNGEKSGEKGSGGFGGLIAPTEDKDVLVRVGNNTVTMEDLAKDPRFKQLVADKIFAAIIMDKGAKERIEITEEQLDKQIAKIKKQFPDPALFEKQLKDSGYTMETLRIEQGRYLILEKMIRDKLQMTEEDLRDFYDQNKRMVDQKYGADNGLTEEETLTLTFETVRETADQLYIEQKGMNVFNELREEMIREYLGNLKYYTIPELTLADFGIMDETAIPEEGAAAGEKPVGSEAEGTEAAGTDETAGAESESTDKGADSATDTSGDGKDAASEGEGEGGDTTTPPAEGETTGE